MSEENVEVVRRVYDARGRASGVDVERSFALLWTLREGKGRAQALQAAGLSQ